MRVGKGLATAALLLAATGCAGTPATPMTGATTTPHLSTSAAPATTHAAGLTPGDQQACQVVATVYVAINTAVDGYLAAIAGNPSAADPKDLAAMTTGVASWQQAVTLTAGTPLGDQAATAHMLLAAVTATAAGHPEGTLYYEIANYRATVSDIGTACGPAFDSQANP